MLFGEIQQHDLVMFSHSLLLVHNDSACYARLMGGFGFDIRSLALVDCLAFRGRVVSHI